MRQVARAREDPPRLRDAVRSDQRNGGTDTLRVALGPAQADRDRSLAAPRLQRAKRRVVLREHQVGPRIAVEVCARERLLVAAEQDARSERIDRFERRPAEAAQQQAEPAVEASGLRLRRERVLREHKVEHTIAVEVVRDTALQRRDLRHARQRLREEPAVAVLEHEAFQFVADKLLRLRERFLAVDLGQRRAREAVVGRERAADRRDRVAAAAETAHGQQAALAVLRLHHVERAAAVEVRRVEPQRMFLRRLVLRVLAEVADDEIDVAVAVEVLGQEALPLTVRRIGELRVRRVDEATAFVREHANPIPLRREQQLGTAVAVEIAEHSGSDHAHRTQRRQKRIGRVHEATAVIAQQHAAFGLGITTGLHARADEQVEVAVEVDVTRSDWPGADTHVRQRISRSARERALTVVGVETITQQFRALPGLDAAAADEQVEVAVAVEVDEHRAHVLAFGIVAPRARELVEAAAFARAQQGTRLPSSAADEHVIAAVAVDVAECERRAELRQAMRQQRLHRVVVERALAMHERQIGLLREPRCRRRHAALVGHRPRDILRLAHDVAAIRFHSRELLRGARRPTHDERFDARVLAEAEVLHRLVAAHVAAHGRHEARLLHTACGQLDARADAVAVLAAPLQRHERAMRSRSAVLEHARFLVEVVRHAIEVAIAIEIAEHRTVAHAKFVEPPLRANVGEGKAAEVLLADVALVDALHAPREVERLVLLPLLHEPLVGLDRVGVVLEDRDAVRRVRVQQPILVEVDEAHRPRPVRAREPGHVRELGELATAHVAIQRVAHVLRRLGVHQEPAMVAHAAHEHLAHVVRGARHVRDPQVEATVVVEVAEVAAHAEERRVRQRRLRYVLERAVAAIAPQPVLAVDVVADVEVEATVVVEVPPHAAEPVAGHAHARGIADVDEARGPIVAQQAIALARGEHAAVLHFEQFLVAARHDRLTALLRGLREREAGERREQLLARRRDRFGQRHFGNELRRQVGTEHAVRQHERIEIAIVVVVRERSARARRSDCEAERSRAFDERAVALVLVEQVLRLRIADVEVEVAVAVDVDERRGLAPRIATVNSAGLLGDVLEAQWRNLAEQSIRAVLADEIQVRQAVAVVVADREARAAVDVGDDVLAAQFVAERDAAVLGGDLRKARAFVRCTRRQRHRRDRRCIVALA